MEQSPSGESNWSSGNQEIRCILLNPKVHNSVHKVSPLARILRWINPGYRIPFYLFKINFNIVLSTTWTYSKDYFFQVSSPKFSMYFSSEHVWLRLVYPTLFKQHNNFWSGLKITEPLNSEWPHGHNSRPLWHPATPGHQCRKAQPPRANTTN